jgi:hypothetical protein
VRSASERKLHEWASTAVHQLEYLLVVSLVLVGCTGRAGHPCTRDKDCDDSVGCTIDECLLDGTCVHAPDDSACDDGVWCTGMHCDQQLGCVSRPRDCGDGVACHVNRCDESARVCDHAPDDSLCSTGETCTPAGCQPCGGPGQPCCPGSKCSGGPREFCLNSVCIPCGELDQACCPSNVCFMEACSINDKCEQCGWQGQVCCSGSVCMTGVCSSSSTCVPCGWRSQVCCADAGCYSGSCSGATCR